MSAIAGPTEACRANGRHTAGEPKWCQLIHRHDAQAYGAKFADPADPLLFSVRSGAAVSMPVSGAPWWHIVGFSSAVVPLQALKHAGITGV